MGSNLVFHITTKRKWQEFNSGGFFESDDKSSDHGIVCVLAKSLKTYINQNFSGRRQVLVLVIDKSRLVHDIHYDKEKQLFYLKRGINQDAILDKIRLKPNSRGIFDIEVNEDF